MSNLIQQLVWFTVEWKCSNWIFLCIAIVPRTELIGDTNRYVKEGSKVTLHCIVSGALDPPLYIFWFHGSEQIYPDNRRSWKTDINRNSLESDHTQSTVCGEKKFSFYYPLYCWIWRHLLRTIWCLVFSVPEFILTFAHCFHKYFRLDR